MSVLPIPQLELQPDESWRPSTGAVQHIYRFPNGYALSVVQGPYSYGGPKGLWEAGVLFGERLTYDTHRRLSRQTRGSLHITDDVIGYLDDDGLADVLAEVARLSPVQKEASV